MAGNPYGGYGANQFITNLFTSMMQEKARKQQEAEQQELMTQRMKQQEFENRMANDNARRMRETLDWQIKQGMMGGVTDALRTGGASAANKVASYYDMKTNQPQPMANVAPMGIPGLSGMPMMQPQPDKQVPLTFQDQPTTSVIDDILRSVQYLPNLTPDAQKAAIEMIQKIGGQAGINVPSPSAPSEFAVKPGEKIRATSDFYNQARNFGVGGLSQIAPAFAGLAGRELPVPTEPTLPEQGMEIKKEEQARKGAELFIGWLKDGTWNTIPPEQRTGVLREIMPNVSEEQISKWASITQGLTEAQKAVINRLMIQTKSLDLAMKQFESSRQIALIKLADQQKRTQSYISRGSRAASGKLNPGTLLSTASILIGRAASLRSWPDKMEGAGTPLSEDEIDNVLMQADQLESQAVALQSMAPAAAQQGYGLTLDFSGLPGTLPAPGFRPPSSGGKITFSLPPSKGKPIRDKIIDSARNGIRAGEVGPRARAEIKAAGADDTNAQLIWEKYSKLYYWPNVPKKRK